MTGAWIETYRGSVAPWECDVTEHFTIAYYFDRVAEAEANLAEHLGIGDQLRARELARRFDIRFARELRAGAAFHIESAAIALDPELRLGHRFIDSVTGERITWFAETWGGSLASEHRPAIAGKLGLWDGPAIEARPDPKTIAGFHPSARGRIKPHEIDEFGRLDLGALIHKFTHSSVQTGAAVGLTADYIKTARRGFSTFELALSIAASPRAGEPYAIDSAITHLGNSSLRLLHVMSDPRSGREWARLGQFGVQLDLDARRPTPLDAELHERAKRLVVPLD
jgi:acyl-CoA thioesterase FadM